MNSYQGEGGFAIWNERSTVADCLRDLGMDELAQKAMKPCTTQELIKKFLTIIEREANKLKKHDVLERLYFAGLIYG